MKVKLRIDEEAIKTYSSEVSLDSSVRFHLLHNHPYEVYETVTGRFTALFIPRLKNHFVREKGFLLKEDIFG